MIYSPNRLYNHSIRCIIQKLVTTINEMRGI